MDERKLLIQNLLHAWREHEHAKAQLRQHRQHKPRPLSLVEDYADVERHEAGVAEYDAQAADLEQVERDAHDALQDAYKQAAGVWPVSKWIHVEDVGVKLGGYGGPAGRTPCVEAMPWEVLVMVHADEPPAGITGPNHRERWPASDFRARLNFLKDAGLYTPESEGKTDG